jgi:hypothetical protein
MLLKILFFALQTSPLSVQALQSRSCLSYVMIKTKVKVTLRLTVSQSVSLGVEPQLRLMTGYFHYCLTVTVLFLWGALSDERTGMSFVYGAGPCQSSLSRVRVPWDSRPYFAVSDLRLPFSSPPMTRRVTVEIFDPASTRVRLANSCQ